MKRKDIDVPNSPFIRQETNALCYDEAVRACDLGGRWKHQRLELGRTRRGVEFCRKGRFVLFVYAVFVQIKSLMND